VVAVEEADPALSEPEREHAGRAVEASMTIPRRFLIEFKDRAVTLGNNPSRNDVNRFNSLRSRDFVRVYGAYLNSSQVQLQQLNWSRDSAAPNKKKGEGN